MSFPWNNYQRDISLPIQHKAKQANELQTNSGRELVKGTESQMINNHPTQRHGYLVPGSQLPHQYVGQNIPSWNGNQNQNQYIQWNQKNQIYQQNSHVQNPMGSSTANSTVSYVYPNTQQHFTNGMTTNVTPYPLNQQLQYGNIQPSPYHVWSQPTSTNNFSTPAHSQYGVNKIITSDFSGWNRVPDKNANSLPFQPVTLPFPLAKSNISLKLPPPPPPPPLPQEKPPPPLLPLPSLTAVPMNNLRLSGKANLNEKGDIHSKDHLYPKIVFNVNQNEDSKKHNRKVFHVDKVEKTGELSSKDNVRESDPSTHDPSVLAAETDGEVQITPDVDSRFEDALTQLKGLSEKWTSGPAPNTPTKKTRNQKKKEKKKKRRKERMKLLELIQDGDHEEKSKNEANNNDGGYKYHSLNEDEITVSPTNFHKNEESQKINKYLLTRNRMKNIPEIKLDDEEMEISDGEETDEKLNPQKSDMHESINVECQSPQHLSNEENDMDESLEAKNLVVNSRTAIMEGDKSNIYEQKQSTSNVSSSISGPETACKSGQGRTSHSPPPTLSSAMDINHESLSEKKERLARALRRIALEKAKAKLIIAQKRRLQILSNTMTDQGSMESSSAATTNKPNTNKISESYILGKKSRSNSPERSSCTSSSSQHKISDELDDITALKDPHIIIRNISSSGPSETVRVVSKHTPYLSTVSESNVSNYAISDTKDVRKREDDGSESKTYGEDQANNADKESFTLKKSIEQDDHKNKAEKGVKSVKKNLELLKSRLRLKLLEKARIERKRKYLANNESMKASEKVEAVNDTSSNLRAVTDDESKDEVINVRQPETKKNKLEKEHDNNEKNIQSQETFQVHGELCTPANEVQDETKEVSSTDDHLSFSSKKDILCTLRERQRVLKDNIDSSKSNQRELKYDMELSNLNTLVNKQREMLAKQAKKVSKGSRLLKECSEEISNEKRNLVTSEKTIKDLQKRKRIMEKMLLSVTKKVVDGRRRRDDLFLLKAKAKGNSSVHPSPENAKPCGNYPTIFTGRAIQSQKTLSKN